MKNILLKIKQKYKAIMLLALLSLVQGCATQYYAYTGNSGYYEKPLSKDMFEVSFKGNENTSKERTKNFALLRSAELALENGYNYFVLLDQKTKVVNKTHYVPKTYRTITYPSGSTRTISEGGYSYIVKEPVATNIIVGFKEKPVNTASYDAKLVVKDLKKEYDKNTFKYPLITIGLVAVLVYCFMFVL